MSYIYFTKIFEAECEELHFCNRRANMSRYQFSKKYMNTESIWVDLIAGMKKLFRSILNRLPNLDVKLLPSLLHKISEASSCNCDCIMGDLVIGILTGAMLEMIRNRGISKC